MHYAQGLWSQGYQIVVQLGKSHTVVEIDFTLHCIVLDGELYGY